MRKRIVGLVRCQRGGTELIAVAVLAVLILVVAFGPGKGLISKVGTKFTNMSTCIDTQDPNQCQ